MGLERRLQWLVIGSARFANQLSIGYGAFPILDGFGEAMIGYVRENQ